MFYRFDSLGCLLWGVIILIFGVAIVSRAMNFFLTTPLGLMIVAAFIVYYLFKRRSQAKNDDGHTYVHVDPREQRTSDHDQKEDNFSRDAEDVDYEEIKRD